MTFPVLIRLGPLALHPHWVFETLAYSLAGYVYARDRRRRGDVVDTRIRWWILGAAAVGGLVGSRLLYLAENPVELTRRWSEPAFLGYDTIFRVLIMQFIDAHSFDVRSVKKTCVHIVHPDGRLIPFDTYNLFYRDGLEQSRLAPLRARADLGIEGRAL